MTWLGAEIKGQGHRYTGQTVGTHGQDDGDGGGRNTRSKGVGFGNGGSGMTNGKGCRREECFIERRCGGIKSTGLTGTEGGIESVGM